MKLLSSQIKANEELTVIHQSLVKFVSMYEPNREPTKTTYIYKYNYTDTEDNLIFQVEFHFKSAEITTIIHFLVSVYYFLD